MFKHLTLSITFLLFTFCLIGQNLEQEIEQAKAAYQSGQLEEAMTQINSIMSQASLEKSSKLLAETYTLKGSILRESRVFDEAKKMNEDALKLRTETFGETSIEVARSLSNLGNIALELNDFSNAKNHFSNSLMIHWSIGSDKKGAAFSPIFGMTKIAIENENFKLADSYLEELKVQFNNSKSTQREIALALLEIDFLLKKEEIEKADILLKSKIKLFAHTPFHHSKFLHKYAELKIISHQLIDAETYLHDALMELEAFGNKVNYQRGLIYQNLAAISTQRGNWNKALKRFEICNSFFIESDFEKVEVLSSIAKIQRMTNRFVNAKTTLRLSMSLLGNFKNHRKLKPTEQMLLLEYGSLFSATKNYKAANFYFQKVINSKERGSNFERQKRFAFLKKAELHLQKKETEEAENALRNAEKFTSKKLRQVFAINTTKAQIAMQKEQFKEAESLLKTASQTLGDSDVFFLFENIQIYSLHAENEKLHATKTNNQNDWEAALSFAQKGIKLLEKLSGNLNDPNSDIDLRARFSSLFDTAITACFELQKVETGLTLTEKFKVNRLQQLAFDVDGIEEKDNSTLQIQELEKQLSYAKRNRFFYTQAEESNSLDQELKNHNNVITKIETQIEKINFNSNEKTNIQSDKKLETIKDFQSNLTDSQTLIHFHRTQEKLYLFLIKKEEIIFEKIEKPTVEIEENIAAYFKLCSTDPNKTKQKEQPKEAAQLVELSSQLYNQLILPIENKIEGSLLIIPDGLMNYLPFSSLIKRADSEPENFNNHHYLINDHPIQYLQSFSDYIKSKKVPPTKTQELLAVAPHFLNNQSILRPLTGNLLEATNFNNKYGGTLWVKEKANKSNFEAQAQKFNLILLATHSFAMDDDPEHSFIAFSEKEDSSDDELMVVTEVYHKNLNADLVVLSSCESAAGKLLRGEGLMNIAQAFFRSGARSVVAALWNVSDEQAPKIMEIFFEKLSQNKPKSEALQTAQILYFEMAIGLKAHPFYWAGFNSFHNDEAIDFPNQISYFVWGIGLTFLIFIFFFGRKLLKTVSHPNL